MIAEREVDNVGADDREFHPVANLFPLLECDQFTALVEDIHTNGLHDSIVLHDGKIVDGRNRYRACLAAQPRVTPHYEEWDGQGSLVAFVISKNLHRRQLTPAQRAAVGADLLSLLEKEGLARKAQGGMKALEARGVIASPDEAGEKEEEDDMTEQALPDRVNLPYLGKSSEQAAGMVGVSPSYVSGAKRVKKEAPEAFEGLRAGTVTMPQAVAIARAPKEQRTALTAKAVERKTTTGGQRNGNREPLNRVRATSLTIDERERYRATVSRVLRAMPWPAVEALLEFGMMENMTVKTLLRLCRETRRDEKEGVHNGRG